MNIDQLIELEIAKQEIRNMGYYIDITLYAGDEVLVQIGKPETDMSSSEYGDTEFLALKLAWGSLLRKLVLTND